MNTDSEKYREYKGILQRAKTYSHLIFYNRKLINPYQLAAFGFRLTKSRDGNEEAKCVNCGNFFIFDPLIQIETMQLKDSFLLVLRKHEEYCKFNYKQKNYLLQLNRQTVSNFGIRLFYEIYAQNKQKLEVSQNFCKNVQLPRQIQSSYLKMVQNMMEDSKEILIISLFGWKVTSLNSIQCEYCGAKQINSSQFDIIQSHRSACALLRQKYWLPIIQKATVTNLENQQGQFLKTQVQVKTKQLRKSLGQTAHKAINSLKQFKYKIKNIKTQIDNISETDAQIQKSQQFRFQRLNVLAEQIEQCIRNGIKKVKIE